MSVNIRNLTKILSVTCNSVVSVRFCNVVTLSSWIAHKTNRRQYHLNFHRPVLFQGRILLRVRVESGEFTVQSETGLFPALALKKAVYYFDRSCLFQSTGSLTSLPPCGAYFVCKDYQNRPSCVVSFQAG